VPIEHVVVLCLENRSFDQMLGFLDHLDPKFGGLLHGGPGDNAGWDLGSRVPGRRKKLFNRHHAQIRALLERGAATSRTNATRTGTSCAKPAAHPAA
jgi:hypothetical protein